MSTNAKQVKQQGIIKQQKEQQALAKTKKQPQTLKDFVIAMQNQIAKALPSVITAERFTRIALTALSSNPKLAQCERNSFLGGLMQAAQLGLEPNTPLGQAYLIPYMNTKKGILECQFQIGYKGLIDLCYRSGEMMSVYAHVVYENDEFYYELGLKKDIIHKPASMNRGNPIYYYAVWKLKNGGYDFSVWSVEDIEAHARKYSPSYKSSSSPWKTEFDEMAKKTALKAALKYAPIKTDFIVEATQKDEKILIADEDLAIHTEYETIEDEAEKDLPAPLATGEITEEQARELFDDEEIVL